MDDINFSYSCDCGMEMSFSNQSRCMSCGRDIDARKVRKVAGLAPGSLKNIGIVPNISAPAAGDGGVAMADSAESSKMAQNLVVYMDSSLNRKDFTCGGCVLATPAGDCAVLTPSKISLKTGACCLYIPGTPHDQQLLQTIPQSVVGYEDDGPFTCGRCENFLPPNACKGVKSGPLTIEAKGCCDAWEKAK